MCSDELDILQVFPGHILQCIWHVLHSLSRNQSALDFRLAIIIPSLLPVLLCRDVSNSPGIESSRVR